MPFERWLAPVMEHHGEVHAATAGTGMEGLMMLVSLVVAASGIGLAFLMYHRGSVRPETFSEALGGVPYRAVLNKYWVDELYEAVVLQPFYALSRFAAGFDRWVIDGLVNASGIVADITVKVVEEQ